MTLKLYNTLKKEKEEFVPVEAGKVKMYVCGPTVYDYFHLGNARAFIVFDVLRRFLQFMEYDVNYVMNLTDIDDKIIERAKREGVDAKQITEKFIAAFFEDIDRLGVSPADHYPKATDHVDDIVSAIQRLVDAGFAYESEGDVFFDVEKFQGYGKLSGKKIEDLLSGARVSVDERKRNPLDFVLWKGQKPGEPAWESPWGPGRPGWHIECSVMSMKYLGESFDIHCGGIDLIFPHHENEIAQSEAVTQSQFVKYWLHNGFLQIEGEKMAKSLGNFRTAREVLKQYSGSVIRLFFLQKHYRSQIDLTPEGLESAARAGERLRTFVDKLDDLLAAHEIAFESVKIAPENLTQEEQNLLGTLEQKKQEMVAALRDDLNTPVAVSRLFDVVRFFNKILGKAHQSDNEWLILARVRQDLEAFNAIFGIYERVEKSDTPGLLDEVVDLLVEVRSDLRKKKEWELSDKIRDQLQDKGVVLEDSPEGTKWKFK